MKRALVALLLFSACAHAQQSEVADATDPPPEMQLPTFDYSAQQSMVENYLAAMQANETHAIAADFALDIIIRDPTFTVLTGQELLLEGKQAFIDYHEPLTAYAKEIDLELENEVYAANFAIFSYTLTVETSGAVLGAPHIESVPLIYDMTTIMEFENGKIAQITDYTDFEAVKAVILSLPPEG